MWVILLATLAASPGGAEERLSFPWTGLDLVRDAKGQIFVDKVAQGRPAQKVGLPAGAQLVRVLSPVPREEDRRLGRPLCQAPRFLEFVTGLPGVQGAAIMEGGDISFSMDGFPAIIGCHGH